MSDEKQKSPNKDIDKALKRLMKALEPAKGKESEPIAPDEIKAHVAVVTAAINWEKAKHGIVGDQEPDLNY